MSDKYIAVDSIPHTIIYRCDDRACGKYHEFVKFATTVRHSEAAQIARALNAVES